MDPNEIAILLRAYDQFTSTFNKFRQSTKGVEQAERDAKTATDDLNKGYDGLLRTLGQLGVLYAVQRGFREIIAVGGDLEDQLLRVLAITGDSTAEARRFILDSTGSRFGPRDQAQILIDLGAAGLTAAEGLQALPQAADFAQAAQIGLNQSAEAGLVLLKTYGLQVSELGDIYDAFTVAANKSALQGEDLTLALSQSAAAARLAGVEYEELLTILAVLRDAGLRASDAGTSVRSMLLHLINPSTEARKIMEHLGIQIYDNEGRMRRWADVLQEFESGLANLDDQSRQYALTALFGSDGIRAMALSMDRGSGFARAMTDELHRTDGATKSVSATMQGSFNAAVDRASGNLDRLATTLFEDIRPALTVVVGLFNDFVVGLQSLPAPVRQALVLLVGAGGLVVALRTIRNLLVEIQAIGGVMGLLKGLGAGTAAAAGVRAAAGAAGGAAAGGGALAALSGPVGWIVAALVVGIPLLITWIGHNREAARAEQEQQVQILALAEEYNSLKGIIDNSTTSTEQQAAAKERLKAVAQELERLLPGLADSWDQLGQAETVNAEKLNQTVEQVTEDMRRAWRERIDDIRQQMDRLGLDLETFRTLAENADAPAIARDNARGQIQLTTAAIQELRRELEKMVSLLYGVRAGPSPRDILEEARAESRSLHGSRPPVTPKEHLDPDMFGGGRGDQRTALEKEMDRLAELIRVRELEMELADGTAQEAGKRQSLIRAYGEAISVAARNVDAMATAHGRNSEEALKATVRLLELRKALQDLNQESRGGFDQDLGRTALFRVTAEANQAAFDRLRAMAASATAQGRMEIVFKGHITSEGPALTDRQVQEIVVPAVSQAVVERYDKGTRHVPEIVAPGANYR